jgi:hypothetical protein
MWEPRPLAPLWASTVCYKGSFTYVYRRRHNTESVSCEKGRDIGTVLCWVCSTTGRTTWQREAGDSECKIALEKWTVVTQSKEIQEVLRAAKCKEHASRKMLGKASYEHPCHCSIQRILFSSQNTVK